MTSTSMKTCFVSAMLMMATSAQDNWGAPSTTSGDGTFLDNMSWGEKETFSNFTKKFATDNSNIGGITAEEKKDPKFVYKFIRDAMQSAGMNTLTFNHL